MPVRIGGLAAPVMKRWGRPLTFTLSDVSTFRGSGFVQSSMQSSLHEALSNGHIVPSCRGGLGYHGPQAFSKQTLVTDGERVGMLCELISLTGMGAGSHPKGLHPRVLSPLWTAQAPTSTVAMLAYLIPALAKEPIWV